MFTQLTPDTVISLLDDYDFSARVSFARRLAAYHSLNNDHPGSRLTSQVKKERPNLYRYRQGG